MFVCLFICWYVRSLMEPEAWRLSGTGWPKAGSATRIPCPALGLYYRLALLPASFFCDCWGSNLRTHIYTMSMWPTELLPQLLVWFDLFSNHKRTLEIEEIQRLNYKHLNSRLLDKQPIHWRFREREKKSFSPDHAEQGSWCFQFGLGGLPPLGSDSNHQGVWFPGEIHGNTSLILLAVFHNQWMHYRILNSLKSIDYLPGYI